MSDRSVRAQAIIFALIILLSQVALFATVPAAAAGSTDPGDWPAFGDDQTNDGNNSESTGPSEIAGLDWRFETETTEIYSSPVVVDGVVYIGAKDGLHAFYTDNGTERWHNSAIELENGGDGRDRVDSPAYNDGYLYIGTAAGGSSSIKKIDATDGSEEWSFTSPGSDFMGGATVVDNGTVYAADHAGTLWAVNASDGTEQASFGTGGYEIESEPAIADGYVYLATNYQSDPGDSRLYALHATNLTKEDEQSIPNSVESGPAVVNGTVYFGTLGNDLYARGTAPDLSTGPRVWKKTDAFTDHIRAAPTVADGKLFVGSMDNTFKAFDVSDGSELWSYDAGDSISASAAYVDDTVYVGDYEGDFFALNASTGTRNWEFPVYGAPNGVKSSPAVVNGSVYFGDYSGDVYKLSTPDSGLPVSENFNSGSPSTDWVTGGNTTWGATVDGSQTLRLTEANDYEAGYAYYDRPFSSTSGSVVEFDYYSADGTGADGLSFFLTDGLLTHRTNIGISTEGGSGLGYAQVDEGDGNETIDKASEQGVPNGYVGVGFDEWGLYASGDEGKDGYKDDGKTREVERPGHVAIRGAGDLGKFRDGYPFLTATNVSEYGGIDDGWRRARITTEPIDVTDDGSPDATRIRVEMSWDDGQSWQTVTDYKHTEVPPDQLKLGFAGATGGSNNIHAIDDLSVREPSDLSIGVTSASTGSEAGETISFEYEVTNDGPNANGQITVTDDVTTDSGGLENYDWSYTTDGANADDNGTGTSVGMILEPGETATVTVTADIGSNVTTDIEHTLTVDESSNFYDPTPSDMSANHKVPIAASVDAGSYGTITEGDAVTLDASGSSGDIAFYEWDLNGDDDYERNETAARVSHVFDTPGTFSIKLRAVTATGGSATDTSTITVDPTDDWPTLGGDGTRTGNNSDTASPTDLDKRWKFDGTRGMVRGATAAADGTVYLFQRRTLYATDAKTGTEQWSVDAGAVGEHELSVVGSTVIIGTRGKIQAFDTADGSSVWTHSTDQVPKIVATDGTVYFVDRTTIGAVEATSGNTEWTEDVSRQYIRGLTVGDGKLFVSGYDMKVVNRSDGSTEWTADLNFRDAPILDGGTLYGTTRGTPYGGGSDLIAVDARTGAEQWRVANRGITKGRMAVANGELYRLTSRAIEARNVTDGSRNWKNSDINPGPRDGGIAVGDGVLYATVRLDSRSPLTQKDFLVVDPADGSVIGGVDSQNSYRGRTQFMTNPVVSDGTVYVGGNKGFYAFGGNLRPTADAGTEKTVEADATVNFDGTGSTDDGTISSYEWEFGDGTTATGSKPNHAYDSAGTYTVKLIVTDDEGATATDELTVTVKDVSVLVAKIQNNTQTVIEDSTVEFSSDAYADEGIATTEWDFDSDGTFDETGATVTHAYATPGDYTVRMRVTDTAGSIATDTANVTVTDVTAPRAVSEVSSKTVDEDTPVSFNGTGSTDNDDIASYEWDFDGDGATDADSERPLYVFGDPGTYTTNLTVTDGAGNTNSTEITVTVNDSTDPMADIGTDSITAPNDVDISFNGSDSTDNDQIVSYNWDFGDGNTTTGETPIHSYSSNGEYTVTLTVEDDAGNTHTDTVEVSVTDDTALIADAGEDTTITRDLPLTESTVDVSFDASGSEASKGILSYEWDFDNDGTIDDTGEELSHTFSPGTDGSNYPQNYTIRMNLTDSQGITVTDTVEVNFTAVDKTPPTANIYSNRTDIETEQPTAFSGSNSTDNVDVMSFEWDLSNDGMADSTSENVTRTFTSPGERDVVLTVTDAAGNTDQTTEQILVEDLTDPTASISANRTAVSIGDTIAFDGTGSTDDDALDGYEWDFDDGISASGTETTHSYTTIGTYNITLTVADKSGNDNSTTETITVSDTTSPTADAGSDQTVDEDTQVTFDGTNSTDNVEVDRFEWDIGQNGSVDLTGRKPSYTFSDSGEYTVELNATDAAGNSDTDIVNVTVEDVVSPLISSFTVTNPSRQDVTVSFDSDEDMTTIVVDIDRDGENETTLAETDFTNESGTWTASYEASRDGTYTATLVTAENTDGDNGASGQSDTITLDQTLDAEITASSGEVTLGSEVEFNAGRSSYPDGTTPTYEWTVDSAIASTENFTHTFDSPGEYTVELTVTAGGATSTDSVNITVEDRTPPVVSLSASDTTPAVGDTVSLDATETTDNDAVDDYDWSITGNVTVVDSSDGVRNVTYDSPGTFRESVTASDPSGNEATNRTTITVRGPNATSDTSSVDFGTMTINSTNATAVRITNDGTTPLNITEASLGDDAFELVGDAADSLPVIRPGSTRPVGIGFSPPTVTTNETTLRLSHNATHQSDLTVDLSGTGVESNISTVNSTFGFGAVSTGDSTSQTATVWNNGSAAVDIADLSLTGASADAFEITDDGDLPGSLDSNSKADIGIDFEPTASGEQTATLRIEAADGTVTLVALTGTGDGPEIGLPDGDIDFGEVGTGQNVTEDVRVANYGSQPLSVDSATITGANESAFTVTSALTTVAPGATELVTVSFGPEAAGNYTAGLTIESNDSAAGTTSLDLTGSAVAPTVDADPRNVDFGNVTVGETVSTNITVTNLHNSLSNLSITSTQMVGNDADDFEVAPASDAPFSLEPGETRDVQVDFTPSEPAGETKGAQLQIMNDAGNEPQIDVWLSNTKTYVVVQEVGADVKKDSSEVNLDAKNVVSGTRFDVNVSKPGTRATAMGMDIVSMETEYEGDFNMNFTHQSTPVNHTLDVEDSDTTQYVQQAYSIDSTEFEETSFEYRVRKDSLPSEADSDSVTFHRYNATQDLWVDHDSTVVKESGRHYVFSVETPGFSEFAVTVPDADDGGSDSGSSSSSSSPSGTNSVDIDNEPTPPDDETTETDDEPTPPDDETTETEKTADSGTGSGSESLGDTRSGATDEPTRPFGISLTTPVLVGIGGFSVVAGLAGALFLIGRQRSRFRIAVGSDDDAWSRTAAIAVMNERDGRNQTDTIDVSAVAQDSEATEFTDTTTDRDGVGTITAADLPDCDLVVWAGEPPADIGENVDVVRWPTPEHMDVGGDNNTADSELRQRIALLFDRPEE